MYPIGEQFQFSYADALVKSESVVKGKYYRFSILSERLIRIEYSKTGTFVDAPTQFALRRNFAKPSFTIKEDPTYLQISTKYFRLFYMKEEPFEGTKFDPMKNLKVQLLGTEKEVEKLWYYGHPEARNYKGASTSIDVKMDGAKTNGLFSLDGFAAFYDHRSKLLEEDGTFVDPPKDHQDVYLFFYHHDFFDALKDYFYLTGDPALLPRYALGNWWSRDYSYSTENMLDLADKFAYAKIPLSVILFDKDWHIRNTGNEKDLVTGYSFQRELIPNPQELFLKLHEKNIRVGLQVNPKQGIYPHEVYYDLICQYLGIHEKKIVLFDPLNPKFLDVYMKVLLHPLESMGMDFFWNDYDEANHLTELQFLNHYHFYDSARNATKRGMLLSRPTTLADHRYGVLYAGKSIVGWKSLRDMLRRMEMASNIGVTWSSYDIGGNHAGIEESELYIRYIELGVFSPILRFHSSRGPYYKKEPWLWDIKTETIAADYLRLRHRLIPYLYTEAYRYHKEGIPLIQPFYYQNPWVYDDENYRNQYFFGKELLVAPILGRKEPVMNRTIHKFYIPEGTWYDFRTGKKFPGNKRYVSFFREEDYPVFARSGAIIPLSSDIDQNNIGNPKDLEIHIFPGKSNHYELYEDDGITSLYREGYFLKTDIDYNYLKSNYTVIIRSIDGKSGIVPETRNYKIRFRNTKKAKEVTVHFNQSQIEATSYLEESDFIVELKNVPTVGQLTVNCKGHDIEIDAVRLINEDIDAILMDLPLETNLKEKVASVIFGDLPIKNKRIEIRKLRRVGLPKDHMKLFLKLLEYIEQI